jgi:hypothetical protein
MPRHEKLCLSNLDALDLGTVAALFQANLKQIVSDLNDRPFDETARTLTLKFAFKPVIDSAGRDLEEVGTQVQVFNNLPKAKTKVYRMIPKADGTLVFSADFADEPNQEPMFPRDEQEKKPK